MADVSRALLIPELSMPSDATLKTLALYWDEVVLLDYADRGFGEAPVRERSDVASALEDGGVLIGEHRSVDVSDLYDRSGSGDDTRIALRLPPNINSDMRKSIEGLPTFNLTEDPPVLMEGRADDPSVRLVVALGDRWVHGQVRASFVFFLISALASNQYLKRAADALAVAEANHCAPIATSVLGHIGSLLGTPQSGVPSEEGCLLSAAISAFEIDPQTPVADILRFRERNQSALGRFRASLTDLTEELQQNGSPQARLASAQDTYRNRVEPALGSLESALKEGRFKFLLKSIVGASVLAFGTVDPKTAVEGGARLTSQTIKYAFSRERMLDQHPFAYLHQLSSGLDAKAARQPTRLLEPIQGDASKAIQRLLLTEIDPRDLMSQFMLIQDFDVMERELEEREALRGD